MVISTINYLRGYLVIEVQGPFLERFINMAIKRNIYLWDIKKVGNSRMILKISTKGFKNLKGISRKAHVKIKILKKEGLPLILYRYRKRKAFFVCVFVIALLILFLSRFIWAIEVSGNERVSVEHIKEVLSSCGLKVGVVKYSIDQNKLKNEVLIQLDELSWLWVDIKGTTAYVKVKERDEAPPVLSEDEPCNIVSTKDGIIQNMIVRSGQSLVKVGDTVTRGQLLVSGIVQSQNQEVGEIRRVHADAEIYARTWYEKVVDLEFIEEKRIRTGQSKKRYGIKFLDKKLNLGSKNSFFYENYDKIEEEFQLRLSKNLRLPLSIIKEELFEVEIERRLLSEEEVYNRAANEFMQELKEKNADITIISIKVDPKTEESGKTVYVLTCESLERIDMKDKIEKENTGD